MKEIKLSQGKVALVDDADFDWLNQWRWWYKDGYAIRSFGPRKAQKRIWMHRLIIGTPEDMETDHVNGDRSDNRRENLRICNHTENARNRINRPNNTSGFRGVFREGKRWRVYIVVDKKQIYLGTYDTQESAAKIYDAEAKKYFGKYARLNFAEVVD